MQRFDVIVIGAGPGGYVAAIRCAQLGLKTAVVESWRDETGAFRLGGTCLNVGCIPSKAMLDSSEKFFETRYHLKEHGILVNEPSLDLSRMLARKTSIVNTLTSGISALFAKNKITWLKGNGRLLDNKTVQVVPVNSDEPPHSATGDVIIIATGSRPRPWPLAPFDSDVVVDSTGALAFSEIPKRLLVIGGGVIGLELGSVWQRLGSEVTVLVRGGQLLSKIDDQVAKVAYDALTAQGMKIALNAKPTSIKVSKKTATVAFSQGDQEQQLKVDKILVAIGREPNTTGLNAQQIGLAVDTDGFIVVDENCQTNVAGIYAIGDVVRGPMLAHKASEEGVAVAERIAGQKPHVNYNAIPWVIYTAPEIAWVGPTSQELSAQGIEFRAGIFPFKGNGRAQAHGATAGLVKIIADAKTDTVLAAHIIGPNASEMIAEAVLAMEFSASAEDIARTVHAHPTLSEAFHEAALAVHKRPLHI